MSYGSNIIKGAGAGAAAGAGVGPWGAVIGAGAGGLLGLISAWEESNDAEEKKKILDQIKKEYNVTQDEIDGMIAEYYGDQDQFIGRQEDIGSFRKAVDDFNPESFALTEDQVTYGGYDKTVDDFVNPYYDKIIDATSKKVQNSAAGAGLGRGTGAATAIAEAVAQKNDELYKTALSEYNQDRAQSYSEWSTQIDKMQRRLQDLRSATETNINNLGTLAQDYTGTRQQQYADELAAKQGRANNNLSLSSLALSI